MRNLCRVIRFEGARAHGGGSGFGIGTARISSIRMGARRLRQRHECAVRSGAPRGVNGYYWEQGETSALTRVHANEPACV